MWKVFVVLAALIVTVISIIAPPPPPMQCPLGEKPGCGDNCNAKCVNFLTGVEDHCPKYACTKFNTKCECDPDQGYRYDEGKRRCVPSSACKLEPQPKPGCDCPKGQELVCDTLCNRRCENFKSNSFSPYCEKVECVTRSCLCDPGQDYWYKDDVKGCVQSKDC